VLIAALTAINMQPWLRCCLGCGLGWAQRTVC